jgi:hypothetical protein
VSELGSRSPGRYQAAAKCFLRSSTNRGRGRAGTVIEPGVHIKWAAEVADHDYAAAQAYLSLKLGEDAVAKAVQRLRKAELTTRRANDILRAAGLTAAPLDDPGVMKDLIKAVEGKSLSPVLVLTGKKGADIADGFHRVSLVYRLDPYTKVPLKLV